MTAPEVATIHLERAIPGVGLIEFVETEKRRDYWFTPEDGKRRQRMPSVTSILRQTWPKPALLEWYARHGSEAETLLDQASARGKAVHRFVETYMASGDLLDPAEFPEDFRPYLRGVAAFLFDYDPQPIAVEQLVVHPELRFAGRLDLIANVRGKRTLLDFKSNPRGRIYSEAHVQAAAYAIGSERCGDLPVEQTLLVGVSDSGAFNPVIGGDTTKLWGAVLAFFAEMRKFERAQDGTDA